MANNAAYYQAMAAKFAKQAGVPVNVFEAQIGQESGWNPNAKSGAGAEGIAQFMPATAAGFHINPNDPVQALQAAAKMDAGNLKKYGSVQRMLSAYNSGRADAYKDPNFAGGQTYNYVKSILAKAGGGQVNAAWGTPGLAKPKGGVPPIGLWKGLAPQQLELGNLVAQQNAFLSGQDYTGPSLAQQMQQFNLMQQSQGGQAFYKPNGVGPVTYPPTTDGKGGLGPLRPPKGFSFLGNTKGVNTSFLNALSQAVASQGGSQVKITSGFRDPQHNAAVGGVQGSLHTKGDALDGYAMIGGKWVPLGTALLPVAKKYGLRSGDVAGFFNGGKDPVHVDYGASLGL
jgi:hypothetical protein